MNDNDIKNAIGCLFESLISEEKEETGKNFSVAIDALVNSNMDLKNMEHFDVLLRYKIDNALELLVEKLNPEVYRNKLNKLFFIYNNYQYFDRNLANLVEQKEGSACCVDKSRWIIKQYREFILTGNAPNMERDNKCFWKPEFGTGEQWMDFCEGLYLLYHGSNSKYLFSIKGLFKL